MPKSLLKSILHINKTKPQHEQDITSSSLRPNLQSIKQKILSRSGFEKKDKSSNSYLIFHDY